MQNSNTIRVGNLGVYTIPAIPPYCAARHAAAVVKSILPGGRLLLRELRRRARDTEFLIDTPADSFRPLPVF